MILLLLLLLLLLLACAEVCLPEPSCCRVCVEGVACGDTCIDPEDECSVEQGCACDEVEVCKGDPDTNAGA